MSQSIGYTNSSSYTFANASYDGSGGAYCSGSACKDSLITNDSQVMIVPEGAYAQITYNVCLEGTTVIDGEVNCTNGAQSEIMIQTQGNSPYVVVYNYTSEYGTASVGSSTSKNGVTYYSITFTPSAS